MNKMELELNQEGMGIFGVEFPNDKSVLVKNDNFCYTLDKVYRPECKQNLIYQDVGKDMVEEVLNGYNGTIFAYGPTGSGKTYTMFGKEFKLDDPEV
jgi:kinesin family member 5